MTHYETAVLGCLFYIWPAAGIHGGGQRHILLTHQGTCQEHKHPSKDIVAFSSYQAAKVIKLPINDVFSQSIACSLACCTEMVRRWVNLVQVLNKIPSFELSQSLITAGNANTVFCMQP